MLLREGKEVLYTCMDNRTALSPKSACVPDRVRLSLSDLCWCLCSSEPQILSEEPAAIALEKQQQCSLKSEQCKWAEGTHTEKKRKKITEIHFCIPTVCKAGTNFGPTYGINTLTELVLVNLLLGTTARVR